VKEENLARRQGEVKIGALLYNSNQTLYSYRVFPDVVVPYPRLATRGPHARGEHAHGGRLAGTVRSEQAEDFARLNVQ